MLKPAPVCVCATVGTQVEEGCKRFEANRSVSRKVLRQVDV